MKNYIKILSLSTALLSTCGSMAHASLASLQKAVAQEHGLEEKTVGKYVLKNSAMADSVVAVIKTAKTNGEDEKSIRSTLKNDFDQAIQEAQTTGSFGGIVKIIKGINVDPMYDDLSAFFKTNASAFNYGLLKAFIVDQTTLNDAKNAFTDTDPVENNVLAIANALQIANFINVETGHNPSDDALRAFAANNNEDELRAAVAYKALTAAGLTDADAATCTMAAYNARENDIKNGTTEFDDLVQTIQLDAVLELLKGTDFAPLGAALGLDNDAWIAGQYGASQAALQNEIDKEVADYFVKNKVFTPFDGSNKLKYSIDLAEAKDTASKKNYLAADAAGQDAIRQKLQHTAVDTFLGQDAEASAVLDFLGNHAIQLLGENVAAKRLGKLANDLLWTVFKNKKANEVVTLDEFKKLVKTSAVVALMGRDTLLIDAGTRDAMWTEMATAGKTFDDLEDIIDVKANTMFDAFFTAPVVEHGDARTVLDAALEKGDADYANAQTAYKDWLKELATVEAEEKKAAKLLSDLDTEKVKLEAADLELKAKTGIRAKAEAVVTAKTAEETAAQTAVADKTKIATDAQTAFVAADTAFNDINADHQKAINAAKAAKLIADSAEAKLNGFTAASAPQADIDQATQELTDAKAEFDRLVKIAKSKKLDVTTADGVRAAAETARDEANKELADAQNDLKAVQGELANAQAALATAEGDRATAEVEHTRLVGVVKGFDALLVAAKVAFATAETNANNAKDAFEAFAK